MILVKKQLYSNNIEPSFLRPGAPSAQTLLGQSCHTSLFPRCDTWRNDEIDMEGKTVAWPIYVGQSYINIADIDINTDSTIDGFITWRSISMWRGE